MDAAESSELRRPGTMNVNGVSHRNRYAALRFAHSRCRRWSAEILDCSKSFRRQPVAMDFDAVMAKFHDKAHFGVVERNDFGTPELEVSFRAGDREDHRVDWFLFIWIDVRHRGDI